MLDYSDFTVVKNNEGIPTAMGIPIHSMLLKNNTPLFMSGGGKGKGNKSKGNKNNQKIKKNTDVIDSEHFIEDGESYDDIHEHLAVPVGLACMTQTVCRKTNEFGIDNNNGSQLINNDDHVHMGLMHRATELNEVDDADVIPNDLYERLIRLAEETKPKKLSRRIQKKTSNKKGKTRKNKTHKKK